MPDYGLAPPGYRLPDQTRIGAVHLQVADMDRSLEYYGSVLGLRPIERNTASAALGPGADHPLIWLHPRAGARHVPRRGLLGLFHFALLLPDRSSLGRFVAHLASLRVAAGSADHAVSEALYLTDPDGLGIEVYADRPRSAWRHRDRQLHLTTEPLDLNDLVRAADGPWTGMPSGTVMGHVHLHVSDLDRAADFYHRGLGLDKVVWDYPGALFMSAGGYHHHLGTNTWASGPRASDDDARLLWWEVVVPERADARAAAGSLAASGYAVTEAEGTWRAADPWGTELELRSTS